MTGSNTQSKPTSSAPQQLPLKGFKTPFVDERSGRTFMIEGMGDGRFRIHTPKRQPRKK